MKTLKLILDTINGFFVSIITYMPGNAGFVLRRKYWKKKLNKLDKTTRIDVGVYFQNPQNISLGKNVWIDRNVIILAGYSKSKRILFEKENKNFDLSYGEVFIDDNTHIAPNCVLSGIGGIFIGKNCGVASNSTIYSFSHHYRNLNDRDDVKQYYFTPMTNQDNQSMILGPVVIESACAIGLNSVILPGITIKKGSWVASGSVLSRDISEQSIFFEKKEYAFKNINSLEIYD